MKKKKFHNIEWLKLKEKDYPFSTISPMSVRPEKYPGDHCSAGIGNGLRQWRFQTQADLDAFIRYRDKRNGH